MMKKKYFDTVSTRVWAVKDVARGARARGDYAVVRSRVFLLTRFPREG